MSLDTVEHYIGQWTATEYSDIIEMWCLTFVFCIDSLQQTLWQKQKRTAVEIVCAPINDGTLFYQRYNYRSIESRFCDESLPHYTKNTRANECLIWLLLTAYILGATYSCLKSYRQLTTFITTVPLCHIYVNPDEFDGTFNGANADKKSSNQP